MTDGVVQQVVKGRSASSDALRGQPQAPQPPALLQGQVKLGLEEAKWGLQPTTSANEQRRIAERG